MSESRPTTRAAPARPVRVQIRTGLPISAVWPALTDPDRLGMWFGDLHPPWRPGGTGRIEFGDGDFFAVTTHDLLAPALIRFEWSFLGVGPPQQIEWRVGEVAGGTAITVTDSDPSRSPAEVEQMRAGWTDFLDRLGGYLATGERTRYSWREEIDGSADLPAGASPLREDLLYQWLPIASDGFSPRWFFVVDADGPRRFAIKEWQVTEPTSITFAIEIPGAENPTRCQVVLEPEGKRLRFCHTGWRDLGLSDRVSQELRGRFAATWTAALAAVRELGAGDG